MDFEVEMGEGSDTANSYVDVDYADAYNARYATKGWPTTDLTAEDGGAAVIASKEAALVRATQAVDAMFGSKFKSYPANQDQALQFPRSFFYVNGTQYVASDTIPKQLRDAVCEVALMDILKKDIFPDFNSAGQISELTQKLDTMSKQVKYFGATSRVQYLGFGKIELLLAPLLEGEGTDDDVYTHLVL